MRSDNHSETAIDVSDQRVTRDRLSVLLIEDDNLDRDLFSAWLSGRGHRVAAATSVEASIQGAVPTPDVVVLDLGLPGLRGLEAVKAIRSTFAFAPIVVLTGNETPGIAELTIDLGAQDYVPKHEADADRLDRAVRHASRRSAFTSERNYQALHDPLTGLPNRTLLADRGTSLISMARRSGAMVAVLYLDLNGFKSVNDNFGHDAGDRLLIELARRLSATLRPMDTLARVGGDEFVVILSELFDRSHIDDVARRLQRAVSEPWIDPEVGLAEPSVAIGVAVSSANAADIATMVADADRACLSTKHSAGESISWSTSGPITPALQRVANASSVTVYYQPIVDRDGTIVGHEALARLIDGEGQVLPPARFLDRLQAAGYGTHLDLDVARTALSDAQHVDLGEVSINLAAATLRDLKSIDELIELFDDANVPLIVEISEQTVGVDAATARGIHRLRRAGIRLALDDFGAGAADLAKLIDIDVDVVKLDRHFVRRLALPERARPVIDGVVGICHQLGHVVVGEGVEFTEQLDRLMAMGVDRWQGYLQAEPRPLSAIGTRPEPRRPHTDSQVAS